MSSSQLSLPLAKGLKLSPKPPGEPQMGMDTDISFRGLSNPQIEKVIQSVRLGGGDQDLCPMGALRGQTGRRVLIGLYVEKCRYEEICRGGIVGFPPSRMFSRIFLPNA